MRPTAAVVRLVTLLALPSLLTAFSFVSFASAVGTTVSAEVCQADASPSLHVTDPVSDSLHSQPNITVIGTVENVTQVEIYIDGSYTQTAAVAQSSDQFEASVTLTPGTHTIRSSGIALCGGNAVEDEVVVTYRAPSQPAQGVTDTSAPPSYGSELPTVINSELPRGNDDEVVNNYKPTESTTDGEDGSLPTGRSQQAVDWSPETLVVWLRGSGSVIGLSLLVFGHRLVSFMAGSRYVKVGRWRLIDILIRGLGLCLIVVSLVFV